MLGRGRLYSSTAFSFACHKILPPAELDPCLAPCLGEFPPFFLPSSGSHLAIVPPQYNLPLACKIKKYLQLKGEQLQLRLGEEEEKLEFPEGVLFGPHRASSGRDPRGRGCPLAQGNVW